ncbi:hypothetical protein KHX94_05990 [Shewanella dokdonensis]|uniref:EF-hand domain-containing protein n=1 Tax=Shewanella dokdonensis TaxID=712036 RepID=A0ABX8DHB6_9GAMM|nr:hypothetical protein [Shewanella dokdonensis]QVK24138.1 hypothetical protein KHX94_05990 [Shewanella dokdonensis]
MDYTNIQKPFETYKWRWGALTPTENINIPEVYYGCLKVLYENQGKSPSDPEIHEGLMKIQNELSHVRIPNLVRTKKRNIFRNSGQYWKITGLLKSTKGGIKLSEFGNAYASGKITRDEFSSYVIKSVEFPNKDIDKQSVYSDWEKHTLKIKPLEIILETIYLLYCNKKEHGYITTEELVNVLIPMSGNKFVPEDISTGIITYRKHPEKFSKSWKALDKDNDHRIAREFLLFLHNYGYLGVRDSTDDRKKKKILHKSFIFMRNKQIVFIHY